MTAGAVAIVLAAGSGERLGEGTPKAFVPVDGRPILVRAASAALASPAVGAVVVTAPPGREGLAHRMLEPLGAHVVVTGGPTRQRSVRAALSAIPADVQAIVCHDAARCLAQPQLFEAVLDALRRADGAIPVVPVADTVKRLDDGVIAGTLDRDELGLAQTPQAFRAEALREAHRIAEESDVEATDDAMLLELAGYRVVAVPGDPGNFKITTREDLDRAERVLREAVRGA